jgi:hypothetical protein
MKRNLIGDHPPGIFLEKGKMDRMKVASGGGKRGSCPGRVDGVGFGAAGEAMQGVR